MKLQITNADRLNDDKMNFILGLVGESCTTDRCVNDKGVSYATDSGNFEVVFIADEYEVKSIHVLVL